MAGQGKRDSTLEGGIDLLDAGSNRFILDTFFTRGKHFLSIHDADVHSVPVNEYFHRHTGVSTALAAPVTAGDTVINVADTSIANLDRVQIEDGIIETTFPIVISGGGTATLQLDRPLDYDFSIGDTVEVVTINMAVVGSISSPVEFRILADGDQVWHIVRFLLGAVFDSAADDSKFGNMDALTNGCILRGYNAASNQYRTFTNWKTNSDIKMDMFNLNYTDKAGPGEYGMNGRGSIKDGTGAAPRTDGAAGDYLELLIQDDLSDLITFRLKAQGHIEAF